MKKIFFYLFLSSLAFYSSAGIFAQNSAPVSPPKLIRILVLEGGGIYGILSTKILAEIEKRTGKPISDLFDVMVGSSTGSIQVALLNTPKKNTTEPAYSTKDVLDFYLRDGTKILTPSLWRRIWTLDGLLAPLLTHKNLDLCLQKHLEKIQLNQSIKPIMIPSYDLYTADIFLFKSHDINQRETLLKDAVIASTSMPNIYPPFEWKFLEETHYLTDAGFVSNDPIILALMYAQEMYPENPKLIVSLGTGYISSLPHPETWKNEGLLHAPNSWLKMIFLGNDHKINMLMEEIKKQKGFGLEYYFRLNPAMPENIGSFLDASSKNMLLLIDIANNFIIEHSKEIDDIIEILELNQQSSP